MENSLTSSLGLGLLYTTPLRVCFLLSKVGWRAGAVCGRALQPVPGGDALGWEQRAQRVRPNPGAQYGKPGCLFLSSASPCPHSLHKVLLIPSVNVKLR